MRSLSIASNFRFIPDGFETVYGFPDVQTIFGLHTNNQTVHSWKRLITFELWLENKSGDAYKLQRCPIILSKLSVGYSTSGRWHQSSAIKIVSSNYMIIFIWFFKINSKGTSKYKILFSIQLNSFGVGTRPLSRRCSKKIVLLGKFDFQMQIFDFHIE